MTTHVTPGTLPAMLTALNGLCEYLSELIVNCGEPALNAEVLHGDPVSGESYSCASLAGDVEMTVKANRPFAPNEFSTVLEIVIQHSSGK